jgi:hypothetical protein
MRTIKFRGLRIDGQGWVYGCYIIDSLGCQIVSKEGSCYNVIPESVGQFTGKLASTKVEIYEGDLILKWNNGITEEVIFNENHLSWYFGFKRLCNLDFLDKITGNINEK